jgi:segregation and condensation protein B
MSVSENVSPEVSVIEPSESGAFVSLPDQIEAILFISDAPAKLQEIARTLGRSEGQVEQGIELLERRYEQAGALTVVRIAGGYQLATKSEFSELVASHLKPQKQRLSKSMLEVLAIVAYKQPITTAEIEAIRGVQSDYGIRVLQERNLIYESGRRPTPGRPIEFSTTAQFLHQFNLDSLHQLQALELDALPKREPNALEGDLQGEES